RLTGARTRSWDLARARASLRRARFPAPSRWGIPPAWAWIAATIVLLTGSTVFWRRPPLPRFREYATLPGQRSQLTLLDGTSVLLSVDSRLRLPRDYGVRERAVELEGEAYFVVRHDATRPFVVRTARGTTEDLGTQFDVRAYREEHLQVVVAEGRVVLRPAARTRTASPLTLHPRERGVIDAGGTVTRTRGIPVARYVSWTRGVLWFHEAPLSGVIAQLGRWYDLEIAVSDSALLAEPLTISFGPESADEALTALARVLDARVTRAGRSVQLIPVAPLHSRMED
ncbi:MAG: hypothetical protein AUG74_14890, partial [Bacteroidetes bacterium 13_1_20CM_4_60_6]